MPLGLWRKEHIIRRYSGCMEVQDGYAIPESYNDMIILMDVQTTKKGHTTDESGDYTLQHLKAFSDDEVMTASEVGKQRADCLWYQGKWFECVSSVLSENTILRHYTSEWTQCLNQEDPPDEPERPMKPQEEEVTEA